MSTAEERMQNEIDELEQENRLLRARNERLEREGEMRRLALLDIMQAEPVQEPFAWCVDSENSADWAIAKTKEGVEVNAKLMDAECIKTAPFPLYTTPPAAQPDMVSGKIFDQFVALNESNAARVLELEDALEAAQRQWVGLTPEEIDTVYRDMPPPVQHWQLARAIEAKLKEKNTC